MSCKETFATSLLQDMLEATPDQYEIYNTIYIIRDNFIASYLILQK